MTMKNEDEIKKYGRECLERTLDLARATGGRTVLFGDAAAFAHDGLRTAREIAQSIFGLTWESHVFEVFDRFVIEHRHLEERADENELQ
jgi:hypothetical protein